jgi:hypothetical protein
MLLISCNIDTRPVGPEQRESRSVDIDKAERLRVRLRMPVGELNVRGGAQKLVEAEFAYNVADWKPDFHYRSGTAADLTVEQHGPTSTSGNAKNRWDLRFNDTIPVDLGVELGAGEARLDLGRVTLDELGIHMGAGTLDLDLRGAPKKDYSVRIQGGVGTATVYLPKDVGISATASGGIGDISVTGLKKRGDHYVNETYDQSTVRIRLDIKGGVGTIKLIAD